MMKAKPPSSTLAGREHIALAAGHVRLPTIRVATEHQQTDCGPHGPGNPGNVSSMPSEAAVIRSGDRDSSEALSGSCSSGVALRRQDLKRSFEVAWRRHGGTSARSHEGQDERGGGHEVEQPSMLKFAIRIEPISGPTIEPSALSRISLPLTATTRSAGMRSCAWETQTW